MKKVLKGTEEWNFFVDMWNLHQDYYTPENDSRYWDNLVANASKLIDKYANEDFGRFAAEIVKCILNNCERKSKGEKLTYDVLELDEERKRKERYVIKEFLEKHEGKTVSEVLNEL
jgi:hypothetical protein